MRAYVLPGTHVAGFGEMRDCLLFIIGLSVPLSAALIIMLRRAYSLAPPLTAAMAGLSSAAAAAALLNFFHPFDATAADLAVHSVAVLIIVAAARAVGGPDPAKFPCRACNRSASRSELGSDGIDTIAT